MIYFVKDFYFPDFGGFGWTDGAKYALPTYMHRIHAIESSATWEEIYQLYVTIHSGPGPSLVETHPATLVETAVTAPFRDRIVALGQIILPHDFFRDSKTPTPSVIGRRYQPREVWRISINMDGDTSWVKRQGGADYDEARNDVFDKLTRDLEGNIWTDWHRFPPKQQTMMQHWAAEIAARNGTGV